MSKGFKWRGAEAKRIAREVAFAALHDGAEKILTESQAEVPHATGTLMRSGLVTDAPSEGAVYVSYSQPYAIRQHEDLTLRHPDPTNPLSTPGRKAKYLEDPFNRLKGTIQRLVELRVKKALRDAR